MVKTVRLLLFIMPLALTGDTLYSSQPSHNPSETKRIRFQIATIEEKQGMRNLVALATIEGAPGTDFTVDLQGAGFLMNSRFLTDVVAPNTLKIRARLNTRMLYGYSERGLPLFEEDVQRQDLQLGLDEGIVLLPFGRKRGDDGLKIEIIPALSDETSRLPSGKLRPLEIKIPQQSPSGIVSVQASKTPHRFTVEATLIEDGREVALGISDYLIEETQGLVLHPTAQGNYNVAPQPLIVNLTLSNYTRTRPADGVQLDFNLCCSNQALAGQDAVTLKWAGIADLGATSSYDLSKTFRAANGKKYELRFKVTLASGEEAD